MAEAFFIQTGGRRYRSRDGRVTDGPVILVAGNAPWPVSGYLGGVYFSWKRDGHVIGAQKPSRNDLVALADDSAEA